MNDSMKQHTGRLTIRAVIAISLFTLLAISLAAMCRYRESLEKMMVNHRKIRQNLTKMRFSTLEQRNTITNFKRLLPPGYNNKSAEALIYFRLDEVKTHLPYGELTIKPLEIREGMLAMDFSYKQVNPPYTSILNTLGQLETAVLPFVKYQEFIIKAASKDNNYKQTLIVNGSILTPAREQSLTTSDTSPSPSSPLSGNRP